MGLWELTLTTRTLEEPASRGNGSPTRGVRFGTRWLLSWPRRIQELSFRIRKIQGQRKRLRLQASAATLYVCWGSNRNGDQPRVTPSDNSSVTYLPLVAGRLGAVSENRHARS